MRNPIRNKALVWIRKRFAIALATAAITAGAVLAQSPALKFRTLSVDSGRPVLAAAEELSNRHLLRITYEDPVYEFADDFHDATATYRVPGAGAPAGQQDTNRIMVMNRGSLSIDYPDTGGWRKSSDAMAPLSRVLVAQNNSGRGGRFRIIDDGNFVHIVPATVRDVSGKFGPFTPLLDTPIDLAPKDRNSYVALSDIIAQLVARTGRRIELMIVPVGLLTGTQVVVSGMNVPARSLLATVARQTDSRLVWSVLYGPGLKRFTVNLRLLPEEKKFDVAPMVPPELPPGVRPTDKAPVQKPKT